MANVLDQFKFSLHGELEALERDLVQMVQERIIKEGSAFPGEVNKIEARLMVDLNVVVQNAASCRTVQQLEG